MKKYYRISAITLYDGLEFYCQYVCERNKILTYKQAEKDVNKYWVHEGTGEELDSIHLIEISKEDYNVLKKYNSYGI